MKRQVVWYDISGEAVGGNAELILCLISFFLMKWLKIVQRKLEMRI